MISYDICMFHLVHIVWESLGLSVSPKWHDFTLPYGWVVFCCTYVSSVQSLSRVWLCDPMDCSTPGFPVYHQLPELAQTRPLSQWCHPTISSSVVPFSSHPQSFSASGSFQMSQLFTSDGQSIGISSSASVLPMDIQDWFPSGLTGLILQSKELSRVFSNTTVQKHQFFSTQLLYGPTLTFIDDYWTNHSFDYRWAFVVKVMSLLFNTLSGLVLAFLPRSKHLLISWLQ